MDKETWKGLMVDPNGKVPPEYYAKGWHYCPDWGGLLISPEWPEWDNCTCRGVKAMVEVENE